MIRKAEKADIAAIADTYTELLTYEQQHGSHSNWVLGVYPTIAVPEQKVPEGSMYVLEEDGEICASMVLNHEQAEEYSHIDWHYPGENEEVLVIHTLCVPPRKAGRGYGRRMVEFAKTIAAETLCRALRIDTYIHNEPAKRLYQKNGFRIAGSARTLHQGVIEEELVYLECKV